MTSSLFLKRVAGIVALAAAICVDAHAIAISSSITDGITGITIPFGDGSVRIPLAGNVMGKAFGEAAAGTTPVTAVATELTPSAGPGVILTAGPPPVGGQVAYPVTTNTHSNIFGSATATTGGLIRGTPSGPGGGVINMVTILGLTPTSATASGVAFSVATAKVNTDPVVLSPLATPESTMLMVDLLSNYPGDPSASFTLTALLSGPDPGQASAHFDLRATTNIPGLSTLFNLVFDLNANAGAVDVFFTSPVMSAPISSSDFTSTGPGSFTLNLAKTKFAVPFTIPAGTLGSDPSLGSIGLSLDVFQGTESIAAVPEPTSLALAAMGLFVLLAGTGVKRKKPAAGGKMLAALVGVVIACTTPAVLAAGVSGDSTMGFSRFGNEQATYALFAYSEVGTPPTVTKNQRSSEATIGQDATVRLFQRPSPLLTDFPNVLTYRETAALVSPAETMIPDPADPAKKIKVGVQINTRNDSFSPALSNGDKDKTRLAGTDITESSTSNKVGTAYGRGVIFTGGVTPALTPVIGAIGKKTNGVVGRGAGAAFDPFGLDPSSIPYSYQVTLDAYIALDHPGDTGGLVFFAVDSRAVDPNAFYGLGQPLDKTVWYLAISANGPIDSQSDFFDASKFKVEFHVNDTSILDLVDGSGNPVSDSDVINGILGAFRLDADGLASLNSYPLFPYFMPAGATLPGLAGDTTYTVDRSGVIYGQGVNAGVAGVPEPSTLLLVALGVLALLAADRRISEGRSQRRTH